MNQLVTVILSQLLITNPNSEQSRGLMITNATISLGSLCDAGGSVGFFDFSDS
jgi:hypothetical protein